MSYIYIGVKEQRVRDLTDQLPDDQHKLDTYGEIGDNYDMPELNGQTFQALKTNAGANSIDAIKT